MSDEIQKNILTEIRARHEQDQRWRNGPSMICPHAHDDRGWLLSEIERLRADRRERIATACMAGLLAHPSVDEGSDEMSVTAVRFADALIARLDAEAKP
jgi:hypothetical protein